jgi:hypothetical protein
VASGKAIYEAGAAYVDANNNGHPPITREVVRAIAAVVPYTEAEMERARLRDIAVTWRSQVKRKRDKVTQLPLWEPTEWTDVIDDKIVKRRGYDRTQLLTKEEGEYVVQSYDRRIVAEARERSKLFSFLDKKYNEARGSRALICPPS